jgi:hypothetical protein
LTQLLILTMQAESQLEVSQAAGLSLTETPTLTRSSIKVFTFPVFTPQKVYDHLVSPSAISSSEMAQIRSTYLEAFESLGGSRRFNATESIELDA